MFSAFARGAYLDDDPNAFERYFEDAKTILDEQIKNGRKVSGGRDKVEFYKVNKRFLRMLLGRN